MPSPDDDLPSRLRNDLTAALKARDQRRANTIRSVLTAVSRAATAGSQATELDDEQVQDVIVAEAKKRRESAEAYTEAGRADLAEQESAEGEILAEYLPSPLTPDEISTLVADAIAQTGAAELGMRGMGTVMGVVTPRTKGRADGKTVSDEVKRQLASG